MIPRALTSKLLDSLGDSPVVTLLQRDVRDMSNIEGLTAMPRLLSLLASRVGSLLNYSDLSRGHCMPYTTLRRYEVKASTRVRIGDFRGLRALQNLAGERFIRGVVLYVGPERNACHTRNHRQYGAETSYALATPIFLIRGAWPPRSCASSCASRCAGSVDSVVTSFPSRNSLLARMLHRTSRTGMEGWDRLFP